MFVPAELLPPLLNNESLSVSPMALISPQQCQSVRTVVVLPDEEHEPPSSLTSVELSKLTKSHVTKREVDAPCILDVDIEKGNAEIPKLSEESIANLKPDDFLTRASPREICLQIGGKFMQLLMNHGAELPKFTSRDKLVAERVHETPNNNRTRKFKRSTSFNSRRVVLLFSVLSSMGTIILIYLTVRVRLISGNV